MQIITNRPVNRVPIFFLRIFQASNRENERLNKPYPKSATTYEIALVKVRSFNDTSVIAEVYFR